MLSEVFHRYSMSHGVGNQGRNQAVLVATEWKLSVRAKLSAMDAKETGKTEKQKLSWKGSFSDGLQQWDKSPDKETDKNPGLRYRTERKSLPNDRGSNSSLAGGKGNLAELEDRGTDLECRHGADDEAVQELERLCEEHRWEEAVGFLESMSQQCIVPSITSYGYLLQGCIERNSLAAAKEMHVHLIKSGLELHSRLGNSVVDMFVKCGSLSDALEVFDRLPRRTAFSWTAIIVGYVKSGQSQKALEVYKQMRREGVKPNKQTFINVLKACSFLGDLKEGLLIHADIKGSTCESDALVSNVLVHLYAKCGSMVDAQTVFDKVCNPDVVSWNTLIAGYVRQEEGEKALQLFAKMQEAGMTPNHRTYVSALKACGSMAALEEGNMINGQAVKWKSLRLGKLIHAEIIQQGYDSDVYVGTTLVDMYAKCGSMLDARQMFDMLTQCNVVSWNAIIAGYTHQKQAEEALRLYAQMQQQGITPNNWTFVSALQACAIIGAMEDAMQVVSQPLERDSLQKGRAIHAKLVRQGYESDSFICNTLVHMYAKCGSLLNARQVFDTLPVRSVVSWSAMIAGYCQHQDADRALELFEQMKDEGFGPDKYTFSSLLKVCGSLAALEEGTPVEGQTVKLVSLQRCKLMHAEAARRGYGFDVFVGTTLVDMYAKCGSMLDAHKVFDTLPHRNVVSWNALIAGYVLQEQGERALHLYDCMQEQGVEPNNRTFVSLLKGCISLAAMYEATRPHEKIKVLRQARRIHADVIRNASGLDVYVGTTLVDSYAKLGSMVDALHAFHALPWRDVVAWSAVIAGFAQQAQGHRASQFYAQMLEEGVKPDSHTFASLLTACGSLAATEEATFAQGQFIKPNSLQQVKEIHKEVSRMGCDLDEFVSITLMSTYADCGSMLDAQRVFQVLPRHNVVVWNALISGYAQNDEGDKAIQLYLEMEEAGVKPDMATILGILKACSRIGALQMCSRIHQDIVASGFEMTAAVATTFIYAFSKCGSMVDARVVFDAMPQHDVLSWTALIAGYAQQGEYESSLKSFKEMQQAGIHPDGITYIAVLSACSHAGLVEKGVQYFNEMRGNSSIKPTIEHYVSLIDLLCRAGLFSQVEALLLEMPIQPDVTFWLALLAACRKYNNVKLGRRAFQKAVELKPQQSSAYVMMSNIYAQAHMWEDSSKIDRMRENAGARKQPGQSWIEHDLKMHVFVVADRRMTERIYTKLVDLRKQITKLDGEAAEKLEI